MKRVIYFATSNKGKFKEVYSFFNKTPQKDIELKNAKLKIEEPRGTLEEVAEYTVKKAYLATKLPTFVEDTGLFIPSLNGFPGEFSAWVVKKIGISGILKLVPKTKRNAYFKTVIGFYDGKKIHLFSGICRGKISRTIRGKAEKSLPYDTIFIPNGSDKTFAEDPKTKEKKSHRIKALRKFLRFLRNYP